MATAHYVSQLVKNGHGILTMSQAVLSTEYIYGGIGAVYSIIY